MSVWPDWHKPESEVISVPKKKGGKKKPKKAPNPFGG
jgi:hypothetical protein